MAGVPGGQPSPRAKRPEGSRQLGCELRETTAGMAEVEVAGPSVQLGRLSWEPPSQVALQQTQPDQPLQVVEGDRAVHAGRRGHLIHGARRRVVEKSAQDPAPGAFADSLGEIVQSLGVYSVWTL